MKMFGKDKVKGHNRLLKGKNGFKVVRVKNFLRKKDEDTNKRNAIIGASAIVGAAGIAYLIGKKKPPLLLKNTVKSQNPIKLVTKTVGTPPKQKLPSDGKEFINQLDSEWNIPKKEISPTSAKQIEEVITPIKKPKLIEVKDPWNLPVDEKNIIRQSAEKVVQSSDESIKLLSSGIKSRENLLIPSRRDKVTSSVINMMNTKRNYDSLPIPMKATIQIEKALTRPLRETNLGRPPDTKGLKTILNTTSDSDIDQVITKASRKINTRLKRQNELLKKKQLDDVVPSPSRRALLQKITPKLDKDKALTMVGDIVEPKAPMSKIIRQMNNLAKNSELEELNITVRDDEWKKALEIITGRREMMTRTKRGLSSATESLIYSRVVKPKVIKALMGELKSGRLQTTNPKGYTQRLQRIQDNLADLFEKEGVNYKKIGRRDLIERTAKIMEPEIDDAVVKAKEFATDGKALMDMLRSNPELEAGLDKAGIKDPKMRTAIRLLSKLSGN